MKGTRVELFLTKEIGSGTFLRGGSGTNAVVCGEGVVIDVVGWAPPTMSGGARPTFLVPACPALAFWHIDLVVMEG
jgi:hypothetical protein